MSEDRHHDAGLARLPTGLVDRLTRPFAHFLRIEAAAGSVLLLFTIAALVLSNSSWSHQFLHAWETSIGVQIGSFEFGRSLREWINDALMTLFFFLVALELKRELVLGELNNARMAALSIAAALGGMLVPAGVYLILQFEQPGESGWGAVMATDTAFVIGCLALLGRRIPQSLRVFMLSLAIVDEDRETIVQIARKALDVFSQEAASSRRHSARIALPASLTTCPLHRHFARIRHVSHPDMA
jgi:NhaA family Na+:H+ antiporter